MSALRKWDKLPDERKRALKNELIDYFDRERDEQIGLIAAGDLLDFFMETAERNALT